MKFFQQLLVTIIGSFIVQYFFPWWTMAIVAFGVSYFFQNKKTVAFLAGFLGVGMLWLGMAFYIDLSTQSILTEKVNKLFPINVFLLMSIVGGLVGGFAALTGTVLRGKKLARY